MSPPAGNAWEDPGPHPHCARPQSGAVDGKEPSKETGTPESKRALCSRAGCKPKPRAPVPPPRGCVDWVWVQHGHEGAALDFRSWGSFTHTHTPAKRSRACLHRGRLRGTQAHEKCRETYLSAHRPRGAPADRPWAGELPAASGSSTKPAPRVTR